MKQNHYFLSMVLLASLCVTQVFAQTGKSLTLNGADQYMSIPNHDDFNISLSESFTVSLWVKASRYMAIANAQRFVAKRDMGVPTNSPTGGDQAGGYELWGAVSDAQFFANNAPGPNAMSHTNSLSVFSSQTGSLDTWVHIALVVDRNDGSNGKMYLYQNGQKVGDSGSKNVSLWYVNNTYDVLIGAGQNTTIQYFLKGEIDNVRFYKKGLSPDEIIADMTSTVGADTEGLVAAYDFENISGLTVPDISGNDHDGLLHNYTVEGDCIIANASINYDTNFTGRGNQDEPILKATLTISGSTSTDCTNMIIKMDGTTNISDVTKIKVYSTGSNNAFDPREVENYTKLGECDPAAGEITCPLTGQITSGTNYLWVTYDIADNAAEGDRVSVKIQSITTTKETYTVNSSATGKREILLTRKLLFAPGDLGSKNYRIPAIVTAHDGSLVTATDKRKANQSDLPEDIDILVKRSTDHGKTWSEALTIAAGTGRGHGYGDTGLVRTNEEGGLLCIFVGGQGFFQSTPANPIRTYVCKSSDNGATWTTPKDITDQLFGSGCTDDVRKGWNGSFCASGAGLLGRDGTIYFVAAVRESSSGAVSAVANYVYYSKDNGETWKVSSCVKPDNGNEAKIVELNDGTLLVSIRNQSKGPRYYSTSTDGGKTWSTIGQWSEIIEPGCDGDIIYYTSTKDGFEKDRILHSVPNHASDRENVTVFVSYDEGKSWPVSKPICPTGSAYSSLCILEDGTIGAYVEENYNTEDYSMYFTNFSLDWLTDGQDEYHAAGTVEVARTPVFSVEGGIYDTPQNVEITCETEGAKIYYTLDGSVPTESSTLYSAPIEISATTTIKAFAIKDGMVASALATVTYTFSLAGKYCYPTESSSSASKLADTYVEKIITTGGKDNLDYTATSRTFFTKVPGSVGISQGGSFNLQLQAKSLGDYSTTAVRQDLRYTVAVMYIDWDGDYVFSSDEGERIAGKLSSEGLHNVGGNMDVLDITKEIQVPVSAPEGIIRARVYYTNAWDTSSGVLSKACGPVNEGVVYDFDIEVSKATGLSHDPASNAIRSYINGDNIIIEGAQVGSIVKVYNITGQLVSESIAAEKITTISGLPSGSSVYLLKITDGSNTTVQKIIK